MCWFSLVFTCSSHMQLSILICSGLCECTVRVCAQGLILLALEEQAWIPNLRAAALKNFPRNSSDLLLRRRLFLFLFSLPRVLFHLDSVIQMGKGPLCCRRCICFLLSSGFAVYFLCNVFSSPLLLFTFEQPHLLRHLFSLRY